MTKKPQATISFNSETYLKYRLDELYKNNIINLYMYINHYAEEDTKKNHIHLYIVPSKPIDSNHLRKMFIEPCENNGDLGCLPFVSSKQDDWLLYALHNANYLFRKGLTRINHYRLEDIISSEPYYCLEQFYHDAVEQYETNRIGTVIDMIKSGYTYNEILQSGIIPPSQIVFYDKVIRLNAQKYYNKKNTDFIDQLDAKF